MDFHFVQVFVLDFAGRNLEFPIAGARNVVAAEFFLFLPVAEITNQVNVQRIRCPFTEHPAASLFVQAVIKVSGGKIREFLFAVLRELIDFPNRMFVTSADCVLIGCQPFIVGDNPQLFVISHNSYHCGLTRSDYPPI